MTVRPVSLTLLLVLAACAADHPAVPHSPAPVAAAPATQPRPPPVPPEGIRLPRNFRPSLQRVTLSIDPSSAGFTGQTTIEGTLDAPTDVVWLNADALEITRAGALLGLDERASAEIAVQKDERIALRFQSPLPAGPVRIWLEFKGTQYTQEDSGIFRQQSGGDWYAFTQFEQTDARRAFPCVDEPSAKIPWELTLRVPVDLTAVANTPVASETPAGEKWKDVRFRQTRPLPSYLVAVAVGPFAAVDLGTVGRHKTPVRIFTPKGRTQDAAFAAQAIPQLLCDLGRCGQ